METAHTLQLGVTQRRRERCGIRAARALNRDSSRVIVFSLEFAEISTVAMCVCNKYPVAEMFFYFMLLSWLGSWPG